MKTTTQVQPKAKLYIVVNRKLPAGLQIAQSVHAFQEFASEHPEVTASWHKNSNYICVLSTHEDGLFDLLDKAQDKEIKHSCFFEPDLDDALTAVAFEPSGASRKLLRKLPLALRS